MSEINFQAQSQLNDLRIQSLRQDAAQRQELAQARGQRALLGNLLAKLGFARTPSVQSQPLRA